jgi:hypothetical protein
MDWGIDCHSDLSLHKHSTFVRQAFFLSNMGLLNILIFGSRSLEIVGGTESLHTTR